MGPGFCLLRKLGGEIKSANSTANQIFLRDILTNMRLLYNKTQFDFVRYFFIFFRKFIEILRLELTLRTSIFYVLRFWFFDIYIFITPKSYSAGLHPRSHLQSHLRSHRWRQQNAVAYRNWRSIFTNRWDFSISSVRLPGRAFRRVFAVDRSEMALSVARQVEQPALFLQRLAHILWRQREKKKRFF